MSVMRRTIGNAASIRFWAAGNSDMATKMFASAAIASSMTGMSRSRSAVAAARSATEKPLVG